MHKRDFGSFHVSNVQELITLPKDLYQPPSIPINLPKFQYDVEPLPHGIAAKQKHFYLDQECTFLNHGAFGSVLKEALEASQEWQRYIERQPLKFYDRELLPHLVYVTRRLADFVGCDASDMVLVPNVTTAVNCVLRSLPLTPCDTVLHFSVEYGAVKKIIKTVCKEKRYSVKEQTLKIPIQNEQQILDTLKCSIDQTTKLVVFDHIPSNTPFIMPVKDTVDICHERNCLVLVDGAHALGQINLNIGSLGGVDFYTSNCHKWFCCPKGAAFLYVAKQHQDTIKPLIISHGYDSGFNSEFIWSGLRDYSPFLALHTVLDFWTSAGMEKILNHNHTLAQMAAEHLVTSWQSELLAPADMTGCMVCVKLPSDLYANLKNVNYDTAEAVQNELFHRYNIEVPIKSVEGHLYVRISAHIYNREDEYHKLADAISRLAEENFISGSGIIE